MLLHANCVHISHYNRIQLHTKMCYSNGTEIAVPESSVIACKLRIFDSLVGLAMELASLQCYG